MNKNEIKEIIIEEIKDVLKEMASPEQLAADSRPEEDDITPPGIEDMSPDPMFGADPSYVEEEELSEMPRTSNIFKLSQEASIKDVLQFMQRVNNVLKTFKSPGQKRPKKRFTPEEMKALATAMLKPEGFTSKDIIANTSYNSPAQANKFLKALEMKGLITLTSQLKKSMEPTRDPNAPETRGRKRRDAEFDMSDDPMADLDALGLGGDIDLSDPLAENVSPSNLTKVYKSEISSAKASDELDIIPALKKGITRLEKGEDPKKVNTSVAREVAKIQGEFDSDEFARIYMDKAKKLSENTNTMSELEKYIKQVIKEAKNPLAQKMKEIENQGRLAALETKLAAVAEMIEETEGRLTRIDEDNEFKEMMDKNAVKEVRKQLKELEKAKGKLEKEKAKLEGKGMKAYKSKEVMDEDIPVAEDTVENAVDEVELEEDDFKLNESVKRMQKLANLKG